MPSSVVYRFTQRLPAPARAAFRWCVDYRPGDLALMGLDGRRRIEWLAEDAVLIRELVRDGARTTRKLKLVRIDRRALCWYNVQLRGPNRHSAFVYRIAPEGKARSRLEFTGLLVIHLPRRPGPRILSRIARAERQADSAVWKRLAAAMAHDLGAGGR
jgi:hypothetical protein